MNDATLRAHAAVLLAEYGIAADAIAPVEGGWSALAYKVTCERGEFFLKAYDKRRHSIGAQLKTLHLSMSVSAWLEANTPLRGRINAPLPTMRGEIAAETVDFTYLLFAFIDGVTPRETPLTAAQQAELAAIVAELHRHGADMPFDFTQIRETFAVSCAELEKAPHDSDASLRVNRERDLILRAIDLTRDLAERVKAAAPPFVLCHADIHGWNLIQGERLMLIDWESVKFAPPEADLYTFWGDWYDSSDDRSSHWRTFSPIYRQTHRDFVVNEDTLRFYNLRRHIEDIDEFYAQYMHDDLSEETRREVLASLERECDRLATLVQ